MEADDVGDSVEDLRARESDLLGRIGAFDSLGAQMASKLHFDFDGQRAELQQALAAVRAERQAAKPAHTRVLAAQRAVAKRTAALEKAIQARDLLAEQRHQLDQQLASANIAIEQAK